MVPKPYEFTWFGDIHGPKPYDCIGFGLLGAGPWQAKQAVGGLLGPKPYEFTRFGDIHGPKI